MSDARKPWLPGWERPVRVPDNVTVEHADPPVATAGEEGSWRVPFRLAADVAAGEALRFVTVHNRNIKGPFVPAQKKEGHDAAPVGAETEDGRALKVDAEGVAGNYVLTAPEGGLRAGERLAVTLGRGGQVKAPDIGQRSKFVLLVRPDPACKAAPTQVGGMHQIVGACTIHVLGGAIDHVRAYVPSQTRPGEPFDVLVRPEDRFCNLSRFRVGTPVASLNGGELTAEASPVEDSTCLRLRVSLPDEGVFRLQVRDPDSECETVTNPTICSRQPRATNVYWGMIHGHTEMSDGTGSLERYFRQIRDEAGLDFGAPGDHDHLHETSDAMWRQTCDTVARWDEPGRFAAILGYEWAKWRRNGDGDRNVYYRGDHRPMYRSDEANFPSPPDLFRALRDEQAIIIPHHTGHSGNFCDWKDHDPARERLVEIFQLRGSYECSEEDGNPVPERLATPPYADGYVRRALAMGWRVGFTAGGDDHLGHAGTDFPIPWEEAAYKSGLMSVQAPEITREAVWDAMWHRRVTATTGPRILLDFTLNGRPMGSEIDATQEEDARERRLHIEFHGTAPLKRIDVIRSNRVVRTIPGGGRLDVEADWVDTAPIGEALLPPAKFCDQPFAFYYVRALQTDGEVAWASPVWLDAEGSVRLPEGRLADHHREVPQHNLRSEGKGTVS